MLVNSGRGDLFIPPVVQIAGGVVLWFLAPAISRTVAKRNDGEAILEGVTEAQLFATAFVGLGAYFSLKSFASVFNWIHFFTINRSPEFGFNQYEDPSYYEFTEEGLTLVAGVFLMCTAKHWAAKLTRKGKIDAGGTGEQNYLTHFTGRKGRSNVPRGVTLKGPIGQVAFAKRDR